MAKTTARSTVKRSPRLAAKIKSTAPARSEAPSTSPAPDFSLADPDCRVYVGDCRGILARLPEVRESKVDLVFADPPFNWNRAYDKWDDKMPREDYLAFTREWIDLSCRALRPGGALWINIPDDTAAEIVMHVKSKTDFSMVNWCIWHYRFGQHATTKFISSKVHVLYFLKEEAGDKTRTWNPDQVLELSDRATTYFDHRTLNKKEGHAGKRVPLDVWYGPYWGRIQGNNAERRIGHDNQLPEVYLDRVIRSTSNPGDLVMDPFLGSGTTGVMARALGRRFIGTEFSKENAGRAFERIISGPARPLTTEVKSSAIFKARKTGLKEKFERAVAVGGQEQGAGGSLF